MTERNSYEYEFLQQIIDTVGDPIFVKDEDHRWIFLNDAYCRFMGYPREELLGKSDYDFFPEEQADVFWEKDNLVFSTGQPHENEELFTDADGKEHVIITKKAMFIDSRGDKFLVGVIRNVTDRRHLEDRLSVARRLMSLGTLAGGMAHEINNPLSYVLANLDYVAESVEAAQSPDSELVQALDAAIRGAERVEQIIEGLETFSDAGDERLDPVDLRQSLQSSVALARQKIRPRARLIEDYDSVPLVDGNEQFLGQVFLNLLTNAIDALDGEDPGENEIRLSTTTDPRGNAVVEIADTGCGIAEKDREHIFDPFFTTKPVGHGTGLGLSICHSLVEAMNGHIEVDSEEGRGTTFRVILPPTRDHRSTDAR